MSWARLDLITQVRRVLRSSRAKAATQDRKLDLRSSGDQPRPKRGTRSEAYVTALGKVDHTHGRSVDEPINIPELPAEFDPVSDAMPIGFVSKCFLGESYCVHTLDSGGRLLEHYTTSDERPADLARGRKLAENIAYATVEVYPDRVVAVRHDGTTTEVT